MRSLSCTLILLAAACSAPAEVEDAPLDSTVPAPVVLAPPILPLTLFDAWDSCGAWTFERRVAELGLGSWSDAARLELSEALQLQDLVSVRAAVLLAHGAEDSRDLLLERLEQRVSGPRRESDASDVVAAAALTRWRDDSSVRRLTALALGDAPHPDLEVRVECAAVALGAGRDEVVPFLIRVLHAGTPAELDDPIDWSPTTTLAWAKQRAAAALAARAEVPDRFRADGPFQHQIEVAEALRARLEAPR